LQIGLTINAAKSLNIDDPAVSPNHYVKPAVTKPPTLGSQLFKSLAQRAVVSYSLGLVSEHSSIALRYLTRAALAHRNSLANCPLRSTALCRRQKFPSATIFSASICST
jgi:hypothetical protein